MALCAALIYFANSLIRKGKSEIPLAEARRQDYVWTWRRRKAVAMKVQFTPAFQDELNAALDTEIAVNGLVNIPQLAEEIRLRNEELNIALEDIASELMRRALTRNALMEF